MVRDRNLRDLLARQLDWGEAHVGFDRAVTGFSFELQGVVPEGFAHSGWELLEHMRRAQADILDFCVNPGYAYPGSPAAYWPDAVPPGAGAWERAASAYRADIESLKSVALDESVDLFDRVPSAGSAHQTYARELILVTDHNAYHLGQLVALRRALGCWDDEGW